MSMSITLAIIILTAIISFTAFSNRKIEDDLIFYPPYIDRKHQWYRFITAGLIHADIFHLLFNMWALYGFGRIVEYYFMDIFPGTGRVYFLVMYVVALVVSLLPTYFNNRDNYYYKSLGASGAVSAVVFAGIFFYPLGQIGLLFLPVKLPGFIFGPIYLGITAYLARRGTDNINHSAHFWGALFGIVYVIVVCSLFSHFAPVQSFLEQVRNYFSGSGV